MNGETLSSVRKDENSELLQQHFLCSEIFADQEEGTGGFLAGGELTALILEMRADYCTQSMWPAPAVVMFSKLFLNIVLTSACCLLAIFQTELTRP